MKTSNAYIMGIQCCEQGFAQMGMLFIELLGFSDICKIDEG